MWDDLLEFLTHGLQESLPETSICPICSYVLCPWAFQVPCAELQAPCSHPISVGPKVGNWSPNAGFSLRFAGHLRLGSMAALLGALPCDAGDGVDTRCHQLQSLDLGGVEAAGCR